MCSPTVRTGQCADPRLRTRMPTIVPTRRGDRVDLGARTRRTSPRARTARCWSTRRGGCRIVAAPTVLGRVLVALMLTSRDRTAAGRGGDRRARLDLGGHRLPGTGTARTDPPRSARTGCCGWRRRRCAVRADAWTGSGLRAGRRRGAEGARLVTLRPHEHLRAEHLDRRHGAHRMRSSRHCSGTVLHCMCDIPFGVRMTWSRRVRGNDSCDPGEYPWQRPGTDVSRRVPTAVPVGSVPRPSRMIHRSSTREESSWQTSSPRSSGTRRTRRRVCAIVSSSPSSELHPQGEGRRLHRRCRPRGEALKSASRKLDKAVSKGVIHQNQAANPQVRCSRSWSTASPSDLRQPLSCSPA